jgi:hypothetical protein
MMSTYHHAYPQVESGAVRPRPGVLRRRAAAWGALLLAASLTVAGCGASSGGHSSDSGVASGAKRTVGAPNADQAAPSGATGPASGPSGSAPASSGRPGSGGTAAGKTPSPATYLVRTATLSVRTPHVQEQLARARQFADRAGGYAGDETTTVDSHGRAASTVQLRVPPDHYDALLTQLAGLGHLSARDVKVQDVTGQVVDVDSRIASQRASVARVRGLMNRATDLSDVVSLESELSTRESALEALEAQQASLKSRTGLATITLRLSEPAAKAPAPAPHHHRGFWAAAGHALAAGWHAFYLTLRAVLVALGVTLPFLVLAALAYAGYRGLRRLRGRRLRP